MKVAANKQTTFRKTSNLKKEIRIVVDLTETTWYDIKVAAKRQARPLKTERSKNETNCVVVSLREKQLKDFTIFYEKSIVK